MVVRLLLVAMELRIPGVAAAAVVSVGQLLMLEEQAALALSLSVT
jgi:hypothetical protein